MTYPRRDTFVPALRDSEPRRPVVVVEEGRELPAPPLAAPMPRSGHRDRAEGFVVATMPLAVVSGLVAALVGITAFGVPLLSVVALLLTLGGFALVWLVAFIAHMLISPDGALFTHVWLTWRYLRAEQKERHERYRRLERGHE